MLLLDTSGLLAAIDSDQRLHRECANALRAASAPLLVTPFVLAELDYLLMTRVGDHAQLALLDEVARGTYTLAAFDGDAVLAATGVMRRYPGVGLADASIVVLAQQVGTRDVLTLDERHFRTLRAHKGKPFRILPTDDPSE